ncbi:Uncharacterized protein APZ42_033414 [Daphnia magna]|uniref:Uncharacterized protein n=1 Tax=Daphnia magna TaxID=35525 RepID=A0A164L478_9CRUS|nr:Uncharacterized protein APZ42_033414 [Daphnia magna]
MLLYHASTSYFYSVILGNFYLIFVSNFHNCSLRWLLNAHVLLICWFQDLLSIRSLIVQVSCLGKAFVCSNSYFALCSMLIVYLLYLFLFSSRNFISFLHLSLFKLWCRILTWFGEDVQEVSHIEEDS